MSLLLLPTALSAAPKAMSLEEAVMLAFRENPTILNSNMQRTLDKFALEIAKNAFQMQYALSGDAGYAQSRAEGSALSRSYASSLNPVLSLASPIGTKYTLTWHNQYDYTQTSEQHTYNPSVQLKIEQPLARGSTRTIVQADLNEAILTELSNRINFEKIVATQINTVVSQYRAVIKSQEALLIQEQALKHDKKTVWEYQQRIQAGQMAPANINEVKKNLYQDKLAVSNAKNNVRIAKQNLLIAVGLDPHADIAVSNTMDLSGFSLPNKAKTLKRAFQYNYDYQIALIGLASKKIDVAKAKDGQRWKIDLTAQATTGSSSGSGNNSQFNSLVNGRNHNESLGVSFSIPIHDLSAIQSTRTAITQLEQTERNLKQQKWQLESDVVTQIHTLESDLEQIQLAKETLKYANKNYEIAKIKVDVGQSTVFELTTKATELTSAKQTLLDEKINFLNDFATLDMLEGNTLNRWHLQLPG